jgi:hypothetical protein
LCENETSGSHCTRRCAAITSATFISSEPHPVKTVEWTIDSIKIRHARSDTYNDSEKSTLYSGWWGWWLSRSPYVHVWSRQ